MSDSIRNVDVLALLLHANADPNRISWDGSRLSAAVAVRSVRAVRLLVDAKADTNAVAYKHGSAPLAAAAAQHESVAVVSALLGAKARVNATSTLMSSTALHEAVRVGNMPAIQLLLKAKADVHLPDGQGREPAAHTSNSCVRRMLHRV